MSQMKVLLLEGNALLCSSLVDALGGIEGIRLRFAGGEETTNTAIAGIIAEFDPDLVIMGWKDFGPTALQMTKHHRCNRHQAGQSITAWVMSNFPPYKLYTEARLADLIMWKQLMTGAILRALVERTRELWAAGQRLD